MGSILIVGAGGAIGSMLRFWVGSRVTEAMGSEFAWGTLTVNIAGSFLIGFLAFVINTKTPLGELLRLGLIVGVLGGFTTFSAFSAETLTLLLSQQWLRAVTYISASVLLCIFAATAGMAAGRQFS